MTSRYLSLRAEQDMITPVGGDDVPSVVDVSVSFEGGFVRMSMAASRRDMSQSQRSASVSGMPLAIFSLLDCGWNYQTITG